MLNQSRHFEDKICPKLDQLFDGILLAQATVDSRQGDEFWRIFEKKPPAFDIRIRSMCNGDTILTVENSVFFFFQWNCGESNFWNMNYTYYWFIFLEYFFRFVHFIDFLIFWVILYWKKMYKNYCIQRTKNPGDMFWDKCHLLGKNSFLFFRLSS